MDGKYIEINPETSRFLMGMKSPTIQDTLNLKYLVHDKKWWEEYHTKSKEERLALIHADELNKSFNRYSSARIQGVEK